MSKHAWTLVVLVDDEALEEHDGEKTAPPNDVDEWEARDIANAADLSLIDLSESELTDYFDFDEAAGKVIDKYVAAIKRYKPWTGIGDFSTEELRQMKAAALGDDR